MFPLLPRQDPEPPIELGLSRPAAPANALPAPEQLQFRTAEAENTSARRCRLCGSAIDGEYYQVGGVDACWQCAGRRKAHKARKGGAGDFLRAGAFGFGAALAGAALYAVVLMAAKIQISLLAIVVGVMVGKAVLKGSAGCQGRRYQILAVALTYFSITSSFVPVLISDLAQKAKDKKATAAATVHAPGQVTVAQAPRKVTPALSAMKWAVFAVLLTGIALLSPFLGLTSGFGGIINLVIIGIGLRQAWRMTRPDNAAIAGPFAS